MPLNISQKDGVMEVRQTVLSFMETRTLWTYYDLEKKLQSVTGKQHAKPERAMSEGAHAWALKYFVPRIAPYVQTHAEYIASDGYKKSVAEQHAKDMAAGKASLLALYARQAANDRLTFTQKCALLHEELGFSEQADHPAG